MSREMKDSGVEWIGEIPGDWNIAKLKRLLNANDGGIWGKEPGLQDLNSYAFRSTEQTVDGKWSIKNPTTRSFTKEEFEKHRLQKGDLLITKSSGSDVHIGKTTLVSEEVEELKAVYSNFMQRIRPNELIISNYLWYCFNNKIIREQFVYYSNSTTGLSNISAFILDNINIPFPNIMKQQIIADFLDIKTSEIDKIVEKTKQSIEELKAYKHSLITETVTKGLNPDVPMKKGKTENNDVIPSHWEEIKVKYFLIEKVEKNQPHAEVLSLYRDYGVVPKASRDDNHNVTSLNTTNYKYVELNDVVINKMKAWQGSLAVSDFNGIVSPAYYTYSITNKNKTLPDFIHYLLRNKNNAQVFMKYSQGLRIGQWDLNKLEFEKLFFPFPPLHEQEEIVYFLNNRITKLDELITKKQQMIKELESYKQSLIYEYVTGKKEVK